MNQLEYENLIAFHPGYYLQDLMEDQGISKRELAKRLQSNNQYINDLLCGRMGLTKEMTIRLSIVFGTSTALWENLQLTYNQKCTAVEKKNI
jgi:HTH-type transcriptional regulator/antitoxin HigA